MSWPLEEVDNLSGQVVGLSRSGQPKWSSGWIVKLATRGKGQH